MKRARSLSVLSVCAAVAFLCGTLGGFYSKTSAEILDLSANYLTDGGFETAPTTWTLESADTNIVNGSAWEGTKSIEISNPDGKAEWKSFFKNVQMEENTDYYLSYRAKITGGSIDYMFFGIREPGTAVAITEASRDASQFDQYYRRFGLVINSKNFNNADLFYAIHTNALDANKTIKLDIDDIKITKLYPAVPSGSTNLISDPGFENGGDGWDGTGAFGVDSSGGFQHSGKNNVYMFGCVNQTTMTSVVFQNLTNLKPNTDYVLVANVRAFGPSDNVFIGFRDAAAKTVFGKSQTNYGASNIWYSDYNRIGTTVNTGDRTSLEAYIGVSGSSTDTNKYTSGLWVDDVVAYEMPDESQHTNLLTNGGFESGSQGWTATPAGTVGGFDDASVMPASRFSYQGNGEVWLAPSAGGPVENGFSQSVTVQKNTEYVFSLYARRFGWGINPFTMTVKDSGGNVIVSKSFGEDELDKAYDRLFVKFDSGDSTSVTVAFSLSNILPGGAQVDNASVSENKVTSFNLTAIPSLTVGGTATLQITNCRLLDGTLLHDPETVFASSDNQVASIGADGVITALKQGSSVISVTIQGYTRTFTLTVSPKPAQSSEPSNSNPHTGDTGIVLAGLAWMASLGIIALVMRRKGAHKT